MSDKNSAREILNCRIYFLAEVFIAALGLFLIRTGLGTILTLVEQPSVLYTELFYIFKFIAGLIAVPLCLAIAQIILQPKKHEVIFESNVAPSLQQFSLLKITRKNFKYQLLWGFLLLIIVYFPINLLGYLIPGAIEIEAKVFHSSSSGLGLYFSVPYLSFVLAVIIIQSCVSFHEEWIFRGFLVNRGEYRFSKYSAIVISSFFFGLSHTGYIFVAIGLGENIFYPIVWALSAGVVGFINASFITRKKWLFPVIFAHFLSNIISTHTIWYVTQGGYFFDIFIFLYVPLILLSLIVLIIQYPRVKKGVQFVSSDIKNYFKVDVKRDETSNDRSIRIIFDILIILSLWLIATIGLAF